ncbi:MAG: CooT family nickel-binding protein [Oscillospiraceae bacterium]|nr:CooT family nickel-binding protein [Oscillospiraceae bacterium]
MCLSTVYQLGRPDKPLAKNVALVREQDGKLQFTDILGVVTELEAKILRVDLMENQILVELPAHQGQL